MLIGVLQKKKAMLQSPTLDTAVGLGLIKSLYLIMRFSILTYIGSIDLFT